MQDTAMVSLSPARAVSTSNKAAFIAR